MVLFTEIIVGQLIKFSVAYYYVHYKEEHCEPTDPQVRRWFLVVAAPVGHRAAGRRRRSGCQAAHHLRL